MIELAVVGVVLLVGVVAGIIVSVRRARRRRNYNPNDIYPLW
jgi:hypothetical protein